MHPCAQVPQLCSFLLQEGENTKEKAPASEEVAVEEKPQLNLFEQNSLHYYTQKVYIQHHCLKGLCYYCGLTIDLPAPNCHNSQHPKPATAGHTTFTVTGDLEATIKEVV